MKNTNRCGNIITSPKGTGNNTFTTQGWLSDGWNTVKGWWNDYQEWGDQLAYENACTFVKLAYPKVDLNSTEGQRLILEQLDMQEQMINSVGVGGVGRVGKVGKSLIGEIKAVNLPAWKKVGIDMEHILSGHTVGGGRVSKLKTLFPQGMSESQIEKAVREAYRYGQKVGTQGDSVLVRGTSNNLTIEMWVNVEKKTIETAYPIFK